MGEERSYQYGNLNGVLYPVAVKTDLDIVVCHLLRKFLCRSFMIVYDITGSR